MSKPNPVVHFEMAGKDLARMSKFYEQVFGWTTQSMGEEMGGYIVATTTESGPDGRPKEPGAINGGFYSLQNSPESVAPSFVIAVENVEQYLDKIKSAGGEIVNEPYDIPGIGKYFSFCDTEGNRVSVLQPNPSMSKP